MNREMDPIELKLKALELRGLTETCPDCPSDETFAAYMDGRVTGKEADEIKTHILDCRACLIAYRAWQESDATEGPPVPEKVLERARALVKPPLTRVALRMFKKAFELLNPGELSLAGKTQPAAVPSRGAESKAEHQYEIVELKPDLPPIETVQIQHLEDTGTLKVTLFPSSDAGEESLARLRVDVFCDENIVQSWPLYREGTALSNLEEGMYRFELLEITPAAGKHETRSLGVMEFDLRG
jgi:hypothetical protein